jgi:hypothetical protein
MPAIPLDAAEPLTAMFGVMLYPADADIEARDRFEALVLAPLIDKVRREGQNVGDELRDWVLAHCAGPFALDQKDLRDRLRGAMITGELVSVVHWLTRNRPEIASWETGMEWLEAMNVKGCTRSAI